MTTTTWIWISICIIVLILELIIIFIVIRKSDRYKHTIDPIDDRIKDMNRERTDIE